MKKCSIAATNLTPAVCSLIGSYIAWVKTKDVFERTGTVVLGALVGAGIGAMIQSWAKKGCKV